MRCCLAVWPGCPAVAGIRADRGGRGTGGPCRVRFPPSRTEAGFHFLPQQSRVATGRPAVRTLRFLENGRVSSGRQRPNFSFVSQEDQKKLPGGYLDVAAGAGLADVDLGRDALAEFGDVADDADEAAAGAEAV